MPGISKSELIRLLQQIPEDAEVGTDDGMVVHAEMSEYADDQGTHPYIHLTLDAE